MYCVQCGKQNQANSKFCEFCGAGMTHEQQSSAVPKAEASRSPTLLVGTAEPVLKAISAYVGLSGLVYWTIGSLMWAMAQSVSFFGGLDIPAEFMKGTARAATWLMFGSVIGQVLGVLFISCSYGLWMRRQWSRKLGLTLMVISAAFTFGSLGFYERVTGPLFIVTFVAASIPVLILAWLIGPVAQGSLQSEP